MRNLSFKFEDDILKSNRVIVLLKIMNNDIYKITYELIDKDANNGIYSKKKIRYIDGAISGINEQLATTISMEFLRADDYSIHIDIRESIEEGYKYIE